jgi:murein DD-endopeptidase MepM/ murein hydrolase activator NlpD
MMNNKLTRGLMNGVLLAAVAAVGITAFQLVTDSEEEENVPNEVQVQMAQLEDTSEETVDADTSDVEADLEVNNAEKNQQTAEEEQDISTETTETGEEISEDVSTAFESEGEEEYSETAETASADAQAVTPYAATLDFSEDTLMEWPLYGTILLDYNMDQTTYFPTLDQYRMSPAIAVQSEEGAPVVAAVEGEVYSISEDPKTGTTLTMELGNGYQAIYGQLKDLTVAEGDVVTKGTTIGYVAAPTIYYSAEGTNLYFAMKKDGEPVDPILYLP